MKHFGISVNYLLLANQKDKSAARCESGLSTFCRPIWFSKLFENNIKMLFHLIKLLWLLRFVELFLYESQKPQKPQ